MRYSWLILFILCFSLVTAVTITDSGYFGDFQQKYFNNSQSTVNTSFSAFVNGTTGFYLPKNSNVTFAHFNISSSNNISYFALEVGVPDGSFEYEFNVSDTGVDFIDNLGAGYHLNGNGNDVNKENNGTTTGTYVNDKNSLSSSALRLEEVNNESLNISFTGLTSFSSISTWVKTVDEKMYIAIDNDISNSYIAINNGVDCIILFDATNYKYFNCGNNKSDGLWHHFVFIFDPTSITGSEIWVDGVQATAGSGLGSAGTFNSIDLIGGTKDGTITYHNLTFDEYTIFNNTKLNSSQINDLYVTYDNWDGTNNEFNGTISNIEDEITNYLAVCTADSGGSCLVPIGMASASITEQNATLDLDNTINYSIPYNFTYDDYKIEKELTDYILTIFSNETATATFYYNNTAYTPTSVIGALNTTFTSSIRADWVDNDSSIFNESFPMYWEINLLSNTSNTSTNTQVADKMYLANSNGCNFAETLNFTIKNGTNGNELTGDLDIFFEVWKSSNTFKRTYNFSFSGNSTYGVCISPQNTNLTIDAQAEYEATGFEKKLYYLSDLVINTVTNFINLILDAGTTQVKFTVTDYDDNPIEDVIIKVLTYDVGTDTYTTTEILESDSEGDAYGQIILNTQWYAFILEYNGAVVLQTQPTKITSTTNKFRISLTAGLYDNYDVVNGITSNLIFTNATKTFSFTFTDPTGSVANACLKITRRSINSDTQLNATCVSSTAGTINLVIPEDVGSNTYIGDAWVEFSDNTVFPVNSLSVTFDTLYKEYGQSGIFVTFLIVLVLIFATIWSPVVSIVMMVLAIFVAIVLKIFYLSPGVVIAFVIMAGISLYRLNK